MKWSLSQKNGRRGQETMSGDSPYDGTQLCAQTDPEVFFPKNNFRRKEEIKLAKSICRKCHLLKACSNYAKTQRGIYGVWVGKMYDGTGYESPISVVSNGIVIEREVA